MTTQLRRLLFLQEIDALLGDLAEEGHRESEENLGFSLEPLSAALERRSEAAHSLDPEILGRYERVRRRHRRAVAPVRRGVCMGCFTKRPTMTAASQAGGIETCERCGRILFRLEEDSPSSGAPPDAPGGRLSSRTGDAPRPRRRRQR